MCLGERLGMTARVVVVTGEIGSGKSTAMAALKDWGYQTLYADQMTNEVYLRDDLKEELLESFGPDVLANGQVDKAFLRAEISSSQEKRLLLNQLTHGKIFRLMGEKVEDIKEPWVFIEIPLYFPNKEVLDELLQTQYVIGIDAPKETRARRIMTRGLTHEEALAIIGTQSTSQKDWDSVDLYIENNSSPAALKEALRDFLTRRRI